MGHMKGSRRWWAGFVAVALAMSTGPLLRAGEASLLDLPLGSAYESNFNDDAGGFTASDVPPAPPTHDWAWGEPTSGPGVAHSGTKVWATNLAGNYRNFHCGAILSPTIAIPADSTASVSFMQWVFIEQFGTPPGGSAWDGGLLFVTSDDGASYTRVDPVGGYTSSPLQTDARTCLRGQPVGQRGISGPTGTVPPSPPYSQIDVDLSAFAGQSVRFVVAMASDDDITRPGWYIDDFAVTIDDITTVEDFEDGPGGFSTVNWGTVTGPLGWEHGVPTTGPSGVDGSAWATNLGGLYGPDECASITSGAIDLTHVLATKATMSWKQWFNANSSAAGGVVQASTDGESWTNLVPVGGYPGTANPGAVDDCLSNVSSGSRGFFGLLQDVGEPMVDQQVDLTPFLGGEVQIRFLFASTSSTPRYEGWYIDDLEVALSLYVARPPIPGLGGDDAPLWSSGGANSSWAHGVATAGPTGETAYGTNLGGNYNNFECSYIESPPVSGALLALNPTLSFEHWYKIEMLSFATAFDGGVVLASGDGGMTWEYLDLPEYTRPGVDMQECLGSYGLPGDSMVFSGDEPAFSTVTADLSDLIGSPTVTIRFLFSSDFSIAYDGWFIKNVNVGGVQLLP